MSLTSTPSYLWNLLHRRKPVQTKVEIVRVQTQRISLLQWRQNIGLVEQAHKLASTQFFQAEMDVLQTEHPTHQIFPPLGVSRDDRAAHQAKCEGYDLCLKYLRQLAVPYVPKGDLGEPTFEPPKEQ